MPLHPIRALEHVLDEYRDYLRTEFRAKDPALLALLPWSVVRTIVPVHFLTADKYYRKWWLRPLIQPLGAYRLNPKSWTWEGYLGESLALLRRGRTIMLFPEGKLNPTGQALPAKPGVIMLAATTGAQVLPLKIAWAAGSWMRCLVRNIPMVMLTLGTPLHFERHEDPRGYRDEADNLLQRIYNL
mgnify:CR=1 FL=1